MYFQNTLIKYLSSSLEPGQPSGNVRYVNARFVNKGNANVRIFPDRGMKKDTGYTVARKSSTLLEFVLKEGPLPYGMDFLVKQDTGKKIVMLYHGKDWLHIDASDDSAVVVEVILLDGTDLFSVIQNHSFFLSVSLYSLAISTLLIIVFIFFSGLCHLV